MHDTERSEIATPLTAAPGEKIDFGVCKSVKVTCVSEIGWRSNDTLMADIKDAGGIDTNQWQIHWHEDNAHGSCSLVEVEALDGVRRKLLIDAGWNPDYMRERFAATGVSGMLARDEIEALFITHEHMDHMFGLQTVLEIRPDITIYVPATFHQEAYDFIAGKSFPDAGARNSVAHTGKLIKFEGGCVYPLMPGLVAVAFDLPILLGIKGEQSLYANIDSKGLVALTGCNHHTVARIVDFAAKNFTTDKFHGLYGGLHLAPFGKLASQQEEVVRGLGRYGFERIACNHCTGLPAVELMISLGYPVMKGTGANGSKSDLYIGNGDSVVFG
jgi:7,8-dihydropterin-6-yl-methyl-4-(beta-D-ribofuranosyl)aminobenzene 5'-phosphate synthase